MRTITIFLLSAIGGFGADWETVRRIPADQNIEVTTLIGQRTRGTFVSATADSVVIRGKSSESSFVQKDVRRVRVYDPSRRVRKGLMWTLIGAGLGAGAGVAACPYCPNEGHASPILGPVRPGAQL